MDVRGMLLPRIRHAMLSLLFPSVLDAGRGDIVHPYVHYARPDYPMPLCRCNLACTSQRQAMATARPSATTT